jgi:high-affinity iron transporter
VLQETLEVALLVSVLIAVSHQAGIRMTWLPFGLIAGFILAFLFAVNTDLVSAWFDYVGLEVVNAVLQILIALALALFTWSTFTSRLVLSTGRGPRGSNDLLLFELSALFAIALAINREGSEILLYLGGFVRQEEAMTAVLMGGGIGFAIGVSVAVIVFYGLTSLPGRSGLAASTCLLALFSGNMLSQAVQQLTQADWLPALKPVWDMSASLPENTLTGQMLYAFMGYEATPSAIQVAAYVAGILLVALSALSPRLFEPRTARLN